jgi:hypothetical protein
MNHGQIFGSEGTALWDILLRHNTEAICLSYAPKPVNQRKYLPVLLDAGNGEP